MTEHAVVFLIADLAGYTALTEAHGAETAASVVARYRELADAAVVGGVRRIELVGDEILFAGSDPREVVSTARRLREAADAEAGYLAIHAGIHAGPAVERDGHYFSPALNLTARLTAAAAGGQILCSEVVMSACGSMPGVEFRSVGRRRFRNVAASMEIFEVAQSPSSAAETVLDPVCRMRVRPDTAPARLPFGGRTEYFCSLHCARRFLEAPEAYTPP